MKWYLRLTLGQQLIGSMISLTMLALNLAPSIAKWANCRSLWPALILPPLIGIILLLVGWIMDRWGWMQRQDALNRQRFNSTIELFASLKRIEDMMKDKDNKN